MQSTIFFVLAIVAFASAKQLKAGPQTFTETSSSSKANDKRYATQEFALYLTPSEIKALNEGKNSANKEAEGQSLKEEQQYILQSYSQPDLSDWEKYAKQPSLEQPKEFVSQDKFLFQTKPVFENQERDFDPFNFYAGQKSSEQEQNIQKDGDKREPEWIQYNPISKSQEESLLHEDLQQQWNRILEHNRGQLKTLSSGANQKQKSEEQGDDNKEPEWTKYNPISKAQEESLLHEDLQQQWNRILEHNRGQLKALSSGVNEEKQSEEQGGDKKEPEWIQYNPISKSQEESLLRENFQQQWNRILEQNQGQVKSQSSKANEKKNTEDSWANKDSTVQWQSSADEETRAEIEKEIEFALKHQAFDFGQENSGAEKLNIQKTPILIHKEVKVTKHLPVHVVKKVKVSVPTPVLVPVPEPYEVKVPHPYPVPYEIIKHIPVPVIRKH